MTFQQRSHPTPFLAGELFLGTRQAAGALCNRHPNVVLKYCEPIACDVLTRLALYDLMAVNSILKSVPRRNRRAA